MGMLNSSSGATALPGMGGVGVPAQSPSAAANAALEAALSGTAYGMGGAGATGMGLLPMGGQV